MDDSVPPQPIGICTAYSASNPYVNYCSGTGNTVCSEFGRCNFNCVCSANTNNFGAVFGTVDVGTDCYNLTEEHDYTCFTLDKCPDGVTPMPASGDECDCPGVTCDCGMSGNLDPPDCSCPKAQFGDEITQMPNRVVVNGIEETQCTCMPGTAMGGKVHNVDSEEFSDWAGDGGTCSNPDGLKECPDGSKPDTSSGSPTCGGKCETKTCVGAKYSAAPNPETCECGYCEDDEPIIWSSPTTGICSGGHEESICDGESPENTAH